MIPLRSMGVFFLLGPTLASLGQDASQGQSVGGVSPSSAPTQASSVTTDPAGLKVFVDEQEALAKEWSNLVDQGATPQQLEAWRQQNASRFAAQQERAMAVGANQIIQPMALDTSAGIPTGASPTLQAFLTTKADLNKNTVQVQNQLSPGDDSGSQAAAANVSTMQQKMAADSGNLVGLTVLLGAETQRQIITPPPPLELPEQTPANLKAFLIARDQLVRDEIAEHNTTVNLDPATQQQAIEQWKEQNAARFQQVQQLAIALIPANQ